MTEFKTDWDVVIIGTGPAGMFCALELAKLKPRLKICMFDKGPLREFGDRQNKTCGWGGSGAFSDGKLDLTGEIGGNLLRWLTKEEFASLMREVEQVYVSYCDQNETRVETEPNPNKVKKLLRLCHQNGMKLIPFPVRHLGTDRAYDIVMGIKQNLESAGVVVKTQTEIVFIQPQSRGFILGWQEWQERIGEENGAEKKKIITTAEGECFARKIVAATGREGDEWLWREALRLGLPVKRNRVDIGVRVEVRAEIMKHLTDVLHEPKIIYHTPCHNDRVRTFCVCPNGYVIKEPYKNLGVFTVNGESYSKNGKQSPNTNFALLVSQAFTEPFNEPSTYAASVARTTNMLAGGDGVLIQRLADIRHNRRSNAERLRESVEDGFIEPTLPEAIAGDLSLAIPARHWCCIMATLKALERIAPGVAGDHTLLYGAEVKFYSNQIDAPYPFETPLPGFYVAGDGSGNTRGLLQSSMQGVIVARDIVKKLS